MKKILFFDMYQTLVDTQLGDKKEAEEKAYKAVFVEFLLKNNVEEAVANTFQSNYESLRDAFYVRHDKKTEHHDFKRILAETFKNFYSLEVDERALLDLIWQYRILVRGDTKIYPNVKETLEILSKEYTMFIASYTQASYSFLELEQFGVKDYFSGFVFSSDIGYKKMSDTFYKKCVEASGTEAENCVMIGDNRLEDIYMAHKNGMKTIWVKNPVTMNSKQDVEIRYDKELELKNFTDLVDLVRTI